MNYLDALMCAGVCANRIACVWELFRHPLVIALVAWGLATRYQTRSKRMELRINTLQHATSTFLRGFERVGTEFLRLQERSSPTKMANEKRLGIHIHAGGGGYVPGQLTECEALVPVINQAFSKKVLDYWTTITNSLLEAHASGDVSKMQELVDRASVAYGNFIRQAGKEVGAQPFWRRVARRWQRMKERIENRRNKK